MFQFLIVAIIAIFLPYFAFAQKADSYFWSPEETVENLSNHRISIRAKKIDDQDCDLIYSGPIEIGDYSIFLDAVASLKWYDPVHPEFHPVDSRGRVLCLNSLGGAFLDGIKIAILVRKIGIATYISKNSKCFSACATIFMAGSTVFEEGGDGHHNRTMHVAAKLGFHSPYIDRTKIGKMDTDTAFKLLDVYRLFVAEMIAQGRNQSPTSAFPSTPMSLLEQTLLAGPDQLVMVDTIDEIGRWNITLTGYKNIRWSKTSANLQQLCQNWSNWIFDKNSKRVEIDSQYLNLSEIKIDLSGYNDRQKQQLQKKKVYRSYYWEYIPAYCDMAVLNPEIAFLSLVDKHKGIEMPWWTLPSYLALPPETKLRTLGN